MRKRHTSILGDNIRKTRRSTGVTVEFLANRIGIPRKSLSDIELGWTPNPGVLTVARIAQALDTTVDSLLDQDVAA